MEEQERLILQKIEPIIGLYNPNMVEITMDTNFLELGAEAVELGLLIQAIEDLFELHVPDSVLNGFEKIGDLVKYLHKH